MHKNPSPELLERAGLAAAHLGYERFPGIPTYLLRITDHTTPEDRQILKSIYPSIFTWTAGQQVYVASPSARHLACTAQIKELGDQCRRRFARGSGLFSVSRIGDLALWCLADPGPHTERIWRQTMERGRYVNGILPEYKIWMDVFFIIYCVVMDGLCWMRNVFRQTPRFIVAIVCGLWLWFFATQLLGFVK